jgi:hypothetical protein
VLFELDGKAVQGGLPIADRHCPFSAVVTSGQVEQLQQYLIAGEGATLLGDLVQSHVYDSMGWVVSITLRISGE